MSMQIEDYKNPLEVVRDMVRYLRDTEQYPVPDEVIALAEKVHEDLKLLMPEYDYEAERRPKTGDIAPQALLTLQYLSQFYASLAKFMAQREDPAKVWGGKEGQA